MVSLLAVAAVELQDTFLKLYEAVTENREGEIP